MINELIIAGSLLASHAAVGAAAIVTYKYNIRRNNPVQSTDIFLHQNQSGSAGVYAVDGNGSTDIMTEEGHMKLLSKQYRDDLKQYRRYFHKSNISNLTDRYIHRLILETESGNITAKCDGYTLDFSNGDQIWIANKYYAYGQFHASKQHPELEFNRVVLSDYTFLKLVHLEHIRRRP